MNDELRTLFVLCRSEQSPGSRYRVYQYLPHLERGGIKTRVITMQDEGSTERSVMSPLFHPLRRMAHYAWLWVESVVVQVRLVTLASRFDRVVLYRLPIWTITRWLLAPRRARMLTDFDDALDTMDYDPVAPLGTLKQWILRRGLQNAILASTTTITSNRHNCSVVERLSRRAEVIPTSIDMARLPFRERTAPIEPRLVIGWMGTPSTAQYLVPIEDALRRVQAVRPVVIRLIGAGRNPFRALDVELVDWSYAGEPDALGRIDIGLMPMPDTPWTRGKAATKALQYTATGAPCVSSRTATNVAILGESDGTIFVTTDDEWVQALLRLIDDPVLRADMGRRGRDRVRACYSVEANAPKLARLIRDPLAGMAPSD